MNPESVAIRLSDEGVGLGLSRQKWFYLPEAHTDFIYAMVGEELGLIGTVLIIVAFCALVFAGIRIATGSRDPYGRLVAGALTGMRAVYERFAVRLDADARRHGAASFRTAPLAVRS